MKRLMFLIVLASVVFTSGCAELVFVSKRDGHDQIYKMRTTGASQTNISNGVSWDHFPDVSPNGNKIVFSSSRGGGENIYIMDIDGSNVEPVTSGTLQRTSPRWSPMGLIAFAYPSYRPPTKIWIINSDGTGLQQVTNPGQNESDDGGHDFYHGGKMIVFSRYNTTTNQRDLYSVYYDGSQDFQQITDTPNISEIGPVVSHDGNLLAYRIYYALNYAIRIVNVGTWTLVDEIVMQPPADKNIAGIDFSRDDSRLFVAIESSDVSGTFITDKVEIFSIGIDGSDQRRLTNNEVADSLSLIHI